MEATRVFTLGDARYFLGIVALCNSLWCSGNDLPVTVLDLGLHDWQRKVLAPHCTLVSPERPRLALLQKLVAPLQADVDVAVLLDSDLLVTAPLTPMIEAATAGQAHAYVDQGAEDRFFPEWAERFDLRAPLRQEAYVNAGALAVSTRRLPGLLPRWEDLCERLAVLLDGSGALEPTDALWMSDQEALNALLDSEVAEDQVHRGAVPGMVLGSSRLADVRVEDRSMLRCTYGGEPVLLLHATGGLKPWQEEARRGLRRTAFTTLLRRALAGDDVVIRVPPDRLPGWLRPGAAGRAEAELFHAWEAVTRRTRPLRRRTGLSPAQRRGE